MTIGESIRLHRRKLNLTQTQLAERLNVTPQAVSKWENDTGLPDITMAVPLARALGTTTDELLRFGERYAYFQELWIHTLHTHGDDPAALLEVSMAALKEFPFDKTFLYRAAVDEQRLVQNQPDADLRKEYLGRAAAHAQLLVEMDPDGKNSRKLRAEIFSKLKEIWDQQNKV